MPPQLYLVSSQKEIAAGDVIHTAEHEYLVFEVRESNGEKRYFCVNIETRLNAEIPHADVVQHVPNTNKSRDSLAFIWATANLSDVPESRPGIRKAAPRQSYPTKARRKATRPV